MSAFEVFLSSTIEDFRPYRQAVHDVLDRRAQIFCPLSEDWGGGYDDTIRKCCDKIRQANGFLLLLGYWYGSIPPNSDRSITHMEFDWAKERWGEQPYPPLAVMEPEPLSEAAKDLQDRAQSLLPKKPQACKKHGSRLQAFHATVKNTWRTVRFFSTQQDLREYSLVSCLQWRGNTLAKAAQENPVAETDLTKEQLGALGRLSQFTAVQYILADSAACPDVPAIALLVWGDDDAGQQCFLRRLLKTRNEFRQWKTTMGRPNAYRYDLATLVQWVAEALGLAGGGEIGTPAELADRVAVELKAQPLYFVLDQVQRLVTGGVMAFWTDFWQPFYDRLQTVRAQQRIAYRLVAIVVDYTGNASAWQEATCQPAVALAADSYRQLFEIPRLNAFTKQDIMHWLLEDMNLTDDGANRLAQIADDVLQDASGNLDPTPQRVFGRLQDNPTLARLLMENTHE